MTNGTLKQMSQLELAVVANQHGKERDFWLDRLSDHLVKTNLPFDYKKKEGQKTHMNESHLRFLDAVCSGLLRLSKGNDYSLNAILATGLTVLLNKYTQSTDIIIGAPIYKHNYDRKNDSRLINTLLVIRNQVEEHMTFKQLLLQVSRGIREATEHYNYPLEMLAKNLDIRVSEGEFPFFDIVLLLRNIHDKSYIGHIYPHLIFDFIRTGKQVLGVIEYDSLLYDSFTIAGMVTHLNLLFEVVLPNLDLSIGQIDILSEEEKIHLLLDFNGTTACSAGNKTLVELFQQQVNKTTHSTALVFSDHHYSYDELNKKANQLARVLRKKGINGSSIVGMLVSSSIEMIVIILGVLKAGGAYLPLEPDFPVNRMDSMLEDCQASLVLTTTKDINNVPFTVLQNLYAVSFQPVVTAPRTQIADFDQLPHPDRSLVDYEKYNHFIGQGMVKNSITLQATRGCPYNCAYCCRVWPRSVKTRSAENIFDEVQGYYRMGMRKFVFIDDIFNLDMENGMRFFNLIIKNNMDLQLLFPSGLRGDILTREYINMMVKAGTITFPLALETASPRLQKLIGKNIHIPRLRENLEYIIDTYPQVILELHTMVGFPGETQEEALMTLDFIKSHLGLHFPYIHILKIYANTRMEKIALEHGISRESIWRSQHLAYHELPETLTVEKSFIFSYQADFLNNYFLSKDRLKRVLPYQMQVLTQDEILQKYNAYLPVYINSFDNLLQFIGITIEELGVETFVQEECYQVPGFNEKLKTKFPRQEPDEDALRVLLLDLSQSFTGTGSMLYDVVEQPLGLMYLMTVLNRRFGSKINGKIAKSRVDFDTNRELKELLDTFNPNVIGIRTLTFYREFFHQTVALLRHWRVNSPIIAGGPYVTADYRSLLQDRNVNLAVLGEGEVTFVELIREIIKNNGKLPGQKTLETIKGLAFLPDKKETGSWRNQVREILMVDQLTGTLSQEPDENIEHINQYWDLAYVIFTSGSTGPPKGTLTEHKNVIRVVKDTNYIDLSPNDRILQLSNAAFDGSMFDIYGALLNGAALIMVKKEDRANLEKLSGMIKKEQITVFFITTALFNALIDLEIGCLGDVRRILFGGERISLEHAKKALSHLGKERLIHVYGPTETTVYASYYFLDAIDERKFTIPIGRPISGTTIYILGSNTTPVPVGVSGEIYIGGSGTARGYLNQPQLTMEKIIPNPIVCGDRLYLTGDLGRWLAEGNIEFLGRIDQQVKIRGFRIEPGEVEYHLLKHERIKEAVILVREDKSREKYLCAYIVPITTGAFETSSITEELSSYLLLSIAPYMIPRYFVLLGKIPLNPNGKVDSRALPVPEISGVVENTSSPQTLLQKNLVDIWSDVLMIEKGKIGIDSDFFQLGGHSLKAAFLASKIHKELNVKLPVVEIFVTPTIRGLSQWIISTGESYYAYAPIPRVEKREYYDVSHAQMRVWVLSQLQAASISFNMPMVHLLVGELHIPALEQTFQTLVVRHESLRTVFLNIDIEVKQKILPPEQVDFNLEYTHLESVAGKEAKARELVEHESAIPFDLATGPLLKVRLIRLGKQEHVFFFNMHHIISDFLSLHQFIHEMQILYDFFEKGTPNPLKPLPIQYKDYAAWHNEQLKGEQLIKHREYWLKHLTRKPFPLELPLDHQRPAIQTYNGDEVTDTIEAAFFKRLKIFSESHQTTIFMTLLTTLNLLFYYYTGQTDIVLGTVIAGREHPDLQDQIGFYLNTLPLRTRFDPWDTFTALLGSVKTVVTNAFAHQVYPFDLLLEDLGESRDRARHPIFDVMVDMVNDNSHPGETLDRVSSSNIQVKNFNLNRTAAKFDLTIYFIEGEDTLQVRFEYNTDLFTSKTIEGMVKRFGKLLEIILENPGSIISNLRLKQKRQAPIIQRISRNA